MQTTPEIKNRISQDSCPDYKNITYSSVRTPSFRWGFLFSITKATFFADRNLRNMPITHYSSNLGIKNWAEEDRPREKLLLKGRNNLSDAELIGILISSGTKELSAIDLSKQILASTENDLNQLAQLSVKDLLKFKGIGEAKAITIVAALELGRRRKETISSIKPKINSPGDVYDLMTPHLLDLEKEEFWIVLLNRANYVIKTAIVSSGGISGTTVDPKVIFKESIENLASGIILVHNHPSGNLKPSESDLQITRKLTEGGNFLDSPILDHIIFSNNGFYSFKDEGHL